MRMSRLFSRTLRSAPSEASTRSHELLLRAGYVRQLSAGIFTLMPLGKRVIDNIARIIREEMEKIGGQEISMPVVHPAEIWKRSGRYDAIDAELTRFRDRNEREMVLAMTHEEAVVEIAREEIQSYRQLPLLVYQIQTKWRDDPRPRAGLIRVREFLMKDSYSLDVDDAGLDVQYRQHYEAYLSIFARVGLPAIPVRSDVGMMGGKEAHEFIYLTPIGEDTILNCDACDYSANQQTARLRKSPSPPEAPLPIEEVHTPGAATIGELCAFLGVRPERTAKAVFLVAAAGQPAGQPARSNPEPAGAAGAAPGHERLVVALLRGDLEMSESKLANLIGARSLRPATAEEIREAGIEPGYGSPIGAHGALVVVDDSVASAPNLVAGANRPEYHFTNTNFGRDYRADLVGDIAVARSGDACPECGRAMRAARGVEVGNIFKLGTRYSEAAGAVFLDREGVARPIVMGSYGIGLGRLLACIAEEHNDEQGLCWPASVAPYSVHLVGLNLDTAEARAAAERLYAELSNRGIEALFDDRDERPGVKLKDADLIGIPIRLTVSTRSLAGGSGAGGVEYRLREAQAGEVSLLPLEGAVAYLAEQVKELRERHG